MEQENIEQHFVSHGGAATNDLFHKHARLNQKQISDLDYNRGHREQVRGQRAQTLADGHLEYQHAKKVQEQVSDLKYKQASQEERFKINIDARAQAIENARRHQEYMTEDRKKALLARLNQRLAKQKAYDLEQQQEEEERRQERVEHYEKLKREYYEQGDYHYGSQPVDKNIEVQRAKYNQELVSNKTYGEEAKKDNEACSNPSTMSEYYQYMARMKKKFGSEHIYRREAKRDLAKQGYNMLNSKWFDEYLGRQKRADLQFQVTKDAMKLTDEQMLEYCKNWPKQPTQLQHLLNKKNYSERSYVQPISLIKTTTVYDTPENVQHIKNSTNTSQNTYKAGWKEGIQGTCAQTTVEDHPEYILAKQNQINASDNAYGKDAAGIREHPKGLDIEHPIFVQGKQQAEILRDSQYSKSKQETLEKFQHYQQMENHPLALQAAYKNDLNSNVNYKREFDEEKTKVCFPETVTEGYDQQQKLKDFKSKTGYAKAAMAQLPDTKFNAAETEQYSLDRELEKLMKNYKQIPRESLFAKALPETGEILTAKELKKHNDFAYKEGSKKLQRNSKLYGIDKDTPAYQQAVKNKINASDNQYQAGNSEHMQTFLSSGQNNKPINAHPEYELSAQNQVNVSNNRYQESAIKANQKPLGIPEDHATFLQAKQSTSLYDHAYTESGRQAIKDFKGFQTMPNEANPIVRRKLLEQELQSKAGYTQEWDEEKTTVNFPAFITPGFVQQKEVYPYQSDVSYTKDLKKNAQGLKFNAADTEKYQQDRQMMQTLKDYDKEFEESKRKPNQYPAGMLESDLYKSQQAASKNASDHLYVAGAKEMMKKNILPVDNLRNTHIIKAQKIASDLEYKSGYNKQILGQSTPHPIEAYPEYELGIKASKVASQNEYKKEHEKTKTQYTMVREDMHIDHPVQVNEMVKQAAYKQSGLDAIKECKGFQTMQDNPIVLQSAYKQGLLSNAAYSQEWDQEKKSAFFPYNLTERYDDLSKLADLISGDNYYKNSKQIAAATKFNAADTEEYQDKKKLYELNHNYKKKYLDEIATGKGYMHMPEQLEDQIRSKLLAPFQSQAHYTRAAKQLAQKYGLTMDDTVIANQLRVSRIASENLYKKGYKEGIVGKTVTDLKLAMPRVEELRKLQQEVSDANYKRQASEMHRKHLMTDNVVLAQQRENSKVVDQRAYRASRENVIATMKGYQTMDVTHHPILRKALYDRDLQSQANYSGEWDVEKTSVNFLYSITPGFAEQQALKPFQGEAYVIIAKKIIYFGSCS